VDKVARSLTAEDLDRLANDLVVLLNVLKGIGDPVDSISFRSLLRQLRDPGVRRGLAEVLRMLRAFGKHAVATQAPASTGTVATITAGTTGVKP
jgi:uncharacterized protein YjgD (DUF1641 family)